LEPLHAIYRRETCLPLVEAALDANQWKLISWFDHAKVRVLKLEEIARLDPKGLAFWNLNTPEDLRQAEERARKLS
jgi:molybdopterin-guanine dinucleotide biosynthesis protein A